MLMLIFGRDLIVAKMGGYNFGYFLLLQTTAQCRKIEYPVKYAVLQCIN